MFMGALAKMKSVQGYLNADTVEPTFVQQLRARLGAVRHANPLRILHRSLHNNIHRSVIHTPFREVVVVQLLFFTVPFGST